MLPYRIRQSHVEDGLQRIADQLIVFMKNLAIVTRRAAQDVLQLGQTETVLQQIECVTCNVWTIRKDTIAMASIWACLITTHELYARHEALEPRACQSAVDMYTGLIIYHIVVT